jgi:hypothetical protein
MKKSFVIISKMNTFFSDMNNAVQRCIAMFNDKPTESSIKSDLSSSILEKPQCIDDTNNTDEWNRFGILSVLYKKYPYRLFGIIVLHILVSVCALVLAWECNRMNNFILRILSTVIATIFSEIYILYYAIYHVIMGFQCYVQTSSTSNLLPISKPTTTFLPPL